MHLEGTVTIAAPRGAVWAYLTDPIKVCECAPGLESVEVLEPDRLFRVTAAVGFGSVRARFSGNMEWVELDAPHRAKMKGHGTASGSAADVVSEMHLHDGPNGTTELRWTADVTIVGQLASLAGRLMGSVSKKLVGTFFDCVGQKIEAEARAGAPGDGAAQPASAPDNPPSNSPAA